MEEGARGNLLRHGLAAPHPFKMPPHKRPAHRKSYRIAPILIGGLTALCVVLMVWGYAMAYQIGYDAAAHFAAEEVRHG